MVKRERERERGGQCYLFPGDRETLPLFVECRQGMTEPKTSTFYTVRMYSHPLNFEASYWFWAPKFVRTWPRIELTYKWRGIWAAPQLPHSLQEGEHFCSLVVYTVREGMNEYIKVRNTTFLRKMKIEVWGHLWHSNQLRLTWGWGDCLSALSRLYNSKVCYSPALLHVWPMHQYAVQ